jgi:hypothetical protein
MNALMPKFVLCVLISAFPPPASFNGSWGPLVHACISKHVPRLHNVEKLTRIYEDDNMRMILLPPAHNDYKVKYVS